MSQETAQETADSLHTSDAAGSARLAQSMNPEISSAEVEALLGKARRGKDETAAGQQTAGAVKPYDLAARDRIFRGRMPALDRIHERWVGEFEQYLKSRIQCPLEVTIHKVQIQAYAEWLASQPSPSSFNLFSIKPWRSSALVAVDAQLLYLLVDNYYGGGTISTRPPVRSALTRMEERLNRVLIDALIKHFREAFKPIAQLELEYLRTELNPHYASIATPTETVLVSRFDIKLNDAVGQLALVFPFAVLDPVRARLDEGLRTGPAESQARWLQGFREHLESAQLDLACVFLKTRLSVKDLLQLKPGDILPIEMPKTATLHSGGRVLLHGKFGRSRGYNAIRITEAAQLKRARQK